MDEIVIGILPASGSATRVNGIPKFCLPVDENLSLLEWHVNKMSQVCDQIRISTRSMWLPIVKNLNLDVEIYTIEPSTMSDAIYQMMPVDYATILIGMPDTFIADAHDNFYEKMLQQPFDITLASWPCTSDLYGRVGQINYDGDLVLEVVDKNFECTFDRMWGGICYRLNKEMLDKNLAHPGLQINQFISDGYSVGHAKCSGKYIDAGKFSGIKELYSNL